MSKTPDERAWPRRHQFVTGLIALLMLLVLVVVAGCVSKGGRSGAADATPLWPPGYTPDDEPSTPVVTLPVGEPFRYQATYQDKPGQPVDWRVTLTKTECGVKTIAQALPNPKWDGGDEHPEYVAAKADPGKEFCIVYWSWENVGKEPGQPDGERYRRAGEDEEMSEHVMENKLGHEWGDVSPHDSTKSLDVYLVPEGAQPEAVWFPFENLVDPTSDYLVATRWRPVKRLITVPSLMIHLLNPSRSMER